MKLRSAQSKKQLIQHTNLLPCTHTDLCLTFHLLLQSEASVNLLELGLHGQPTDVGLQVGAVHHADAEHYERDVLGFRAHQAASPPACTRGLVGRGGVLLLVLKDHFAERL